MRLAIWVPTAMALFCCSSQKAPPRGAVVVEPAPASASSEPAPAAAHASAIEPVLDQSRVPLEAASPEAFVPAGWRVEQVAQVELDGRPPEDLAVLLVEQQHRALLFALLQPSGGYRRVGIALRLRSWCITCPAALAPDGSSSVELKGNYRPGTVLLSRRSTQERERGDYAEFVFEPAPGRVVLKTISTVLYSDSLSPAQLFRRDFLSGEESHAGGENPRTIRHRPRTIFAEDASGEETFEN